MSILIGCETPQTTGMGNQEQKRLAAIRQQQEDAQMDEADRNLWNAHQDLLNTGFLFRLAFVFVLCDRFRPVKIKTERKRKIAGGEGGIRTLGTLLGYGALAKRCFRPLSHLTKNWLREYGEELLIANCPFCNGGLRPSFGPQKQMRRSSAVAKAIA